MNWIKIDYEKLLEIIRSAYMLGGHDSEEGCKEGSEERAKEIYEELVDDEVIEEPKGNRYKSVDDFFKETGFSLYESSPGICSDHEIRISRKISQGIFEEMVFIDLGSSGRLASRESCEQKLLEWANDGL